MITFHFTFPCKKYWGAWGWSRKITSTLGHFEKFWKKSWIWDTPYKREISLGRNGRRVCWLEWIEEAKVEMTHNDSSHLVSAYYLSSNLYTYLL